ncbi:MAG: ABC transporter ATP-binding protein [Selenomonadaceae bacterium]|nr:ABC transporter ATP-binding protein [Selenomonadaceae bacterium]
MSVAIKAEHLTKIYKIYERDIDRLKETFHPFHKRYSRDFYALNDISFEIRRGENVGLVGKNGAGKSTLLKIITGVLTPSGGTLEVNGRIASLLELGAGFNPEMTGVENIYMNGLLIGHSREVMDAKIDDIIAFADIGDFINQPVKTYSSGMFARLAFAVNAFVEPDILIVDEALSVGDAFFQSKCIDKMRSMIAGGVTVIFVSHDTFAVKNLCERAFLMQGGKILMDAAAKEVVEVYRNMLLESRGELTEEQTYRQNNLFDNLRGNSVVSGHSKGVSEFSKENLERGKDIFMKNATYQRIGDKRAVFENVQLLDLDGEIISEVIFGQEVILRMVVKFQKDVECLGMGYHIRNATGIDLIYTDSRFNDTKAIFDAKAGEVYVIDWKFKVELRQEMYDIACVISTPLDETLNSAEMCDFIPCALQFNVISPNAYLSLPGGYVHWHNELKICRV